MDSTFIDELTQYPTLALQKIGTSQKIVALLTDNPDVEIGSEEAESVFDKYLFDYNYVDDTIQSTAAYIWVEVDVTDVPTTSVKDLTLYVTVTCHKQFMKLNGGKFKGVIGNRRDNLVRYVDKLIDGSNLFGIGTVKLKSVRSVSAPSQFTARELVYIIPDFYKK